MRATDLVRIGAGRPLTALASALTLVAALCGSAHAADAKGEANIAEVKQFLADTVAAAAQPDPTKAMRAVAERYISPDYIQHAAGYPPGREGFIQDTVRTLAHPPSPAPAGGEKAMPKDVYYFADGDYVVWASEVPVANDPTRKTRLVFNVFKIVDGKFSEHWDSN
jgi:predicted SnoaL-like aldol condensation-catalyzing enzyme